MSKKYLTWAGTVLTAVVVAAFSAAAQEFAPMLPDTLPCGANLTCIKSGDEWGTTLRVTGTGDMWDYQVTLTSASKGSTAPWGHVDKVIIEEGVTYIGAFAFYESLGLKEVIVDAATPPTFKESQGGPLTPPQSYGYGAFPIAIKTAILRVPQDNLNDYKAADVWKEFGYFNPHTVTFDIKGMIFLPTTKRKDTPTYDTLVSYGDKVIEPAQQPSKTDFSFIGWLIDNDYEGMIRYDFNSPVTSDITLRAGWVPTTSVASLDRITPPVNPSEETAIIVTAQTSAFTAGPNPASFASGGVAFFRNGSRIESGALSVFDASGNAVRHITLSDDVGGKGKRNVGSWDLRDANGRAVPSGTYLVRGTVNTSGGKTERVSAVVGVR